MPLISFRTPDTGATGLTGGKVAISANGDTVLWSTTSSGVMVSINQANFTTMSSLPTSAVIAFDKRNNTVFYAASGSTFYVSANGGVTFTPSCRLGASTAPFKIVVNPNVTGMYASLRIWAFSTRPIQAPHSLLCLASNKLGASLLERQQLKVDALRCSRQRTWKGLSDTTDLMMLVQRRSKSTTQGMALRAQHRT